MNKGKILINSLGFSRKKIHFLEIKRFSEISVNYNQNILRQKRIKWERKNSYPYVRHPDRNTFATKAVLESCLYVRSSFKRPLILFTNTIFQRVSYNRIVTIKVDNYTIIINGIEQFVKVCEEDTKLEDCDVRNWKWRYR